MFDGFDTACLLDGAANIADMTYPLWRHPSTDEVLQNGLALHKTYSELMTPDTVAHSKEQLRVAADNLLPGHHATRAALKTSLQTQARPHRRLLLSHLMQSQRKIQKFQTKQKRSTISTTEQQSLAQLRALHNELQSKFYVPIKNYTTDLERLKLEPGTERFGAKVHNAAHLVGNWIFNNRLLSVSVVTGLILAGYVSKKIYDEVQKTKSIDRAAAAEQRAAA